MKNRLRNLIGSQPSTRHGLLMIVLTVVMLASNTQANAQELVTRVYPLDALLTNTLTLANPSDDLSGGMRAGGIGGGGMGGGMGGGGMGGGGMGGGGMGGGGMGGGGMGGGGMFRIPDNILPQFGGVALSRPSGRSISADDILDLVDTHMPGSENAKLSILGTSLWATAPEVGHQAIEKLLTALSASQKGVRSVQVDLRMVTLPPDESLVFANATGAAALEAIEKVAASSDAAKTTIRCDNHSIGAIASGVKRSYIVNATPVVGGDSPPSRSIGYRPETEEILLGLFGRVRPRMDDKGGRARIEVALQLTSGAAPEEIAAANYTDGGIIDRLELEISTLETTVAATENQWTLAGITALTDPASSLTAGDALSHMVTIVRWSEVK